MILLSIYKDKYKTWCDLILLQHGFVSLVHNWLIFVSSIFTYWNYFVSECMLEFCTTVEHPKPRFLLWWQEILEMIHILLSKHIFVGDEGKGDRKTPRLRTFVAVTRNSSKLLNWFSCYQVFAVPWKVCGSAGRGLYLIHLWQENK